MKNNTFSNLSNNYESEGAHAQATQRHAQNKHTQTSRYKKVELINIRKN